MILNEDLTKDLADLQQVKKDRKLGYYKLLMDPFAAPLCRVPSGLVAPSTLLRDRETFQITIGAAGDFVGFFAPENMLKRSSMPRDYVFLAQNASSSTYYQTANFNDHFGLAAGNYASRVSQTPGGQYYTYFSQARLVAAGIRFRYIGRADAHSGIICAGLISNASPMEIVPLNSGLIAESLYPIRATPGEQLVCNWFPFDANSTVFSPFPPGTYMDKTESQQVFVFNGFGLPSGTVLDVEVVRCYEYIPTPAYHELLVPATLDRRVDTERNLDVEGKLHSNSHDFVTATSVTLASLAQKLLWI